MDDALLLPRLLSTMDPTLDDLLTRPLLGDGSEASVGIPALGFVWEEDGEEILVDALEKVGDSLQEVEDIAMENLLSIQVEWDVRTSEDSEAPQAMIGHHPYASECILSSPHLLEIQSFLGAESLAVAIPVRGMIAIQNANPTDMDDLLGLLQWAQYVFQDADDMGLTDYVFLVKDGVLQAVIQPEEETILLEGDLEDLENLEDFENLE